MLFFFGTAIVSPLPASHAKCLAVIPAAGAGLRMQSRRAKQFLDLTGRPLLVVTLEVFEHTAEVDAVVLVVPEDYLVEAVRLKRDFGLHKIRWVVPGGARRQDSVRRGLEAAGPAFDLVMVHDGVRPLVDGGLIRRLLDAARRNRAVVPALPVKETIKEVDLESMAVRRTLPRETIWAVQTPQVFRYADLWAAHRRALAEDWSEVTDDAALLERAGLPVTIVPGSETNLKITTPRDLELARLLLARAATAGAGPEGQP